MTGNLKHTIRNSFDDSSPRIIVLIYAVAKAHQQLLSILNLLDKLRYIFLAPDLIQHLQHGFISAAMPRPVQRRDGAGDRRVHVGDGRLHVAHGGGRAVEFVLDVEDEEGFDGADDGRVGGERMFRPIDHMQEVLDISQLRVRWKNRLVLIEAEAGSSYCRSASENSVNMHVSLLLAIVDFDTHKSRISLRIERRKNSHQRTHHSHRMRRPLIRLLDTRLLLKVSLIGGAEPIQSAIKFVVFLQASFELTVL